MRCGARAGDCTPRYSQAGDGLVACCDAEVPGCVAVRFSAEQDHCDCVFPRKVDAAMLAGHRAECAAAVEQWGRIADAAAEEARGLKNGGASASASPPATGDDNDGGGGVAAAGKAADPDHSVKPAVSKPVAPRPEMVPVSIARLKHRAKLRERMPMPPAIGPVLVRAYAAWWGGGVNCNPERRERVGRRGGGNRWRDCFFALKCKLCSIAQLPFFSPCFCRESENRFSPPSTPIPPPL